MTMLTYLETLQTSTKMIIHLEKIKTYVKEELTPLLIISHCVILLLGPLVFFNLIILTCLLWPQMCFVWLAYYCWVYYDRNTIHTGGRKWPKFKFWFSSSLVREYFPIRLVKTAELDPKRNYLMPTFPHGIFPQGLYWNFLTETNKASEVFPDIDFRCILMEMMLKFPFSREYFLAMGATGSSEVSITNLLTSKPSKGVILLPGGNREACCTRAGKIHTIVKSNRKGFIRISLKTGAPLVPVYSFGEANTCDVLDLPKVWPVEQIFSLAHKYFRVRPCLFRGRGFFQSKFGILPKRHPLITVVGEPIPVPKVDNPSSELIDEYHEKFYQALHNLFEKHKHTCDEAGSDAQLIMI